MLIEYKINVNFELTSQSGSGLNIGYHKDSTHDLLYILCVFLDIFLLFEEF